MKKITLLSLIIISMASCKKDRVCTCTYQDGSLHSEATYTNMTRKEAKTYCTNSSQGVSCSVK